MRGDPIYLHPPDTRYRLRSDPAVPLFTGTAGGGRLWLVVSGCRLEFDAEGWLASAADDPGGAGGCGGEDGPIDVRQFWLPDRRLGISDFPLGCVDLPPHPAQLSEADWHLLRGSDWADGRMFTLQLGGGRGQL